MRRRLIVAVFILLLSFSPAFAGHSLVGGYACSCETAGCMEDYPGECGGNFRATQQGTPSGNATSELGIVIVALLLLLRLKAQ